MPEIFYNPDSHNAFERYMGLVQYAAEQGMGQDQWFLEILEQLNLYGDKGNRELEDKIFQAIRDKSLSRETNSSLYIFEKPPTGFLPKGGVDFGSIYSVLSNNKIIDEGIIFKCPLRWFPQHIIQAGKQGSGKTCFAGKVIDSLARNITEPYRIDLIEFEKEEFKYLEPYLNQCGKKIQIHRPYDGTLNLKKLTTVPPYTHPRTWANITASIVEKSLGLPDGARRLYKIAYRTLQEKYGAVAPLPQPQYCGTLKEIYEEIGRLTNVHHATKSTLMMRLKECMETFGDEAPGCNHKNNVDQEDDSGFHNYILHELDYPYKLLYLNCHLNYHLESRIGAMAQGYEPPLAIEIIEEAKALLSDPDSRFFFYRLEATRGVHICMWFITQTSDIQKDALNACSLKILGKMDANEIYKLAPSLRMTDRRQIQWAADNLQQRLFIVRTDNGAFTKPFLVKAEEMNLVRPQIVKPPQQIESLVVPPPDNNATRLTPDKPSPLSSIEMEYLRLFIIWPPLPITEYDRVVKINDSVGVGRSTGDRVRKKFIENGLIEIVLIKAGGSIKKFGIPWVTQKGKELLPSEIAPFPSLGIGAGIAHSYKSRLIGFILREEGYIVDYDRAFVINDTKCFVDVAATKAGTNHTIAVEVEESLKRDINSVLGNLEKCIALGFDKIYVVFPSKSICEKVKREIQTVLKQHPQVQCVTLSYFIELRPNLWKRIVEYTQTQEEMRKSNQSK